MKQILIELDDACVADLERVAPVTKRMRAEFIRLAIRSAVDLALDRATEAAYQKHPQTPEAADADLLGWDDENKFAKSARAKKSRKISRTSRAA